MTPKSAMSSPRGLQGMSTSLSMNNMVYMTKSTPLSSYAKMQPSKHNFFGSKKLQDMPLQSPKTPRSPTGGSSARTNTEMGV